MNDAKAYRVASFTQRTTDSLEDITLHLKLGTATPEPCQFLAVIGGQALRLATLNTVTLHPVAPACPR